ncbi:MAG: alpha-amylase family glycosyl hydrolase, partial [Bacteroidota bacterium]
MWAKEAVWYQIFPERFRNGDKNNDPTVNDIRGSWPHDELKEWHISSWTGDWYTLQPWEEANGKGFYYNAQLRRYGGDLQGVIDKLDYLKKLGINAIYLNPIFESPSLHKYDATMYHHVDNNFGPDPEGDRRIWSSENPADPKSWKWTSADKRFLKLLSEAHKRNMRVIIDGVFNHVGMTFWAIEDVKKNGEKSTYKDWFTVKSYDNPATPENEFSYDGWFGVKELPELREDANGLLPGSREHIQAIVKRWGDPNSDGNPSDGVDGWRLDVADMVAIPFWQDFRKWVRA